MPFHCRAGLALGRGPVPPDALTARLLFSWQAHGNVSACACLCVRTCVHVHSCVLSLSFSCAIVLTLCCLLHVLAHVWFLGCKRQANQWLAWIKRRDCACESSAATRPRQCAAVRRVEPTREHRHGFSRLSAVTRASVRVQQIHGLAAADTRWERRR